MIKHLLILVLLTCCCVARGEDKVDRTAPARFSSLVRGSEYLIRYSGKDPNRREKKISNPELIESIARILAEATYRPTLPGFSITHGGFAFYSKEKLSMALSIEPGRILRVSHDEVEENMVVEQSTIDALSKVYELSK